MKHIKLATFIFLFTLYNQALFANEAHHHTHSQTSGLNLSIPESEKMDINEILYDKNKTQSTSSIENFYAESVIRKIKRVGQLNFPRDNTLGKLYGTVRVSILINKKGHIIDTKLVNSSLNDKLDRQTLKIIKMSDPLPPPPSDLMDKFDQYELIRTFEYLRHKSS